MKSFETYEQSIEWINGLISFGIKPGLQRMNRLMQQLDYPQRRLRFIHVAGTNGKGSVCAMLYSVLQKCGYSVGLFTSPYIESFTNRIQCDGKDIPEDEVVRIANKLKPLADELAASELGSPTMFEIVTAMAIEYFANVAYPDVVVLETGLGGREDSTNVVVPVVSVITNIGHDHMDRLGDSLEQIAAEKAGIIKSGVPVVCAAVHPQALSVIEGVARENKATIYVLGKQFHVQRSHFDETGQTVQFTGPFRMIPDVRIRLAGAHQAENAAAALMALEVLRQYYALIVEDEDLLKGMLEASWPGRLEMVSRNPNILLDGAHNPEGAEALAAALKEIYKYRKLRMMIGMLSTKNHSGYLRHILPLSDTLIITEPDFRKKLDAHELRNIAESLISPGDRVPEMIVEPDWSKALDRLLEMTGEEDLAVVTGTLYLIADVRSRLLNRSHSEKGW